VCFGRKKNQVLEIAHLIPTRDAKEAEHVIIPWSSDYSLAKSLYIETRASSIRTLCEIQSLRQEVGEHRDEYFARRTGVTQHFWSLFQKLRQICLHPFLVSETGENSDLPAPTVSFSPDSSFLFPSWFQDRCQFVNRLFVSRFPLSVRNAICTHLARAERWTIQPSPKMMVFWEMLKTRRKVVAVSQFRRFLELILKPWLERNGVQCALFCGGSRPRQQQALYEFHNNPSVRVLLLVKTAGAHGLNLQADSASVVIFDPHFHQSLDEQSASRVDRIGQTEKRVMIRKLLMKGSVDEAMMIMQQKKQANCDAWMSQTADKTLTLDTVGLFLSETDSV
jgi:SNF2 family DNA or RNA helicase